jgi:hypothetical protein
MASSWGFDSSQYYPGFPSAYTRIKLGWDFPHTPVIGMNAVANAELQSDGTPQIYMIGEEFGFPQGEYLLIENRQLYGIDSILPKAGMAIYHVDEKAGLDDEGYPGQNGWPQNGLHYRVALLQADGFYNLEKGDNKGGGRDFFHADDINILLPSEDPMKGPFPNTDAYQGGNIFQTGVKITDISVSADVMSFQFSHPDARLVQTADPSPLPSWTPSDKPSSRPSPIIASSQPTSIFPNPVPSAQLPSYPPSSFPSRFQSSTPTVSTSPSASYLPSDAPSLFPTKIPTRQPSSVPSLTPSISPPTGGDPMPVQPSKPSLSPSRPLHSSSSPSRHSSPSDFPSLLPSRTPSLPPSISPSEDSTDTFFPIT